MVATMLYDPAEVVDAFCRIRGVKEWMLLEPWCRGPVTGERELLVWLLSDLSGLSPAESARLMGWHRSTATRRRRVAHERAARDDTYREILGDLSRRIREDLR